MSREFHTQVDIDASAQRVWEVLTDFAAYPQWNPFIPRISGTVREGSKLFFWFTLPFGGHAPALATMLVVKPGVELRWAGQLPIPGLIRAEHYHRIEPLSAERVRFAQGEIFSGVLVPSLWPLFAERGLRLYQQSSLALKERVERLQRG